MNKNLPIVILFFTLLVLYFGLIFRYNKQYNINIKDAQNEIIRCNQILKLNKENDEREYCEWKITTNPKQKPDATYIFFEIVLLGTAVKMIYFLLPLLILLCSLINISKYFKNGYLKNIYLRTDYLKFIKKEKVRAYLLSLIIPVIFILVFLIVVLVFGNFDYRYSMANYDYIIELSFFKNFWFNIIMYLIIPVFHFMFIINIGFLMIKKNNNIILSTVYSFLIYMCLWLFSEGVIGQILLKRILNITSFVEYFNFQSFWSMSGIEYPILLFFINLLFFTVTSFMVNKSYSNKESVMIANE